MTVQDEVGRLAAADKAFGADPRWFYDASGAERFVLNVPLTIDYVTEEGFYFEGNCITALPDRAVTFVMTYKPSGGLHGPVARFDWEPLHTHENRGLVKGEWRYKRFCATHLHSYEMNQHLGWERMVRENLPIALPVSESMKTFREMLSYLGRIWRIRDIQRIPEPEWQPRLNLT